MAQAAGMEKDRIAIHAFLDGRDTPPRSALEHLGRLQKALDGIGAGRIATVIGRYWAMDRDKRWERVQKAYDCLSLGLGEQADSWAEAVERSYANDVGDEFVEPTVIGSRDHDRIRADDGVIFFNYRADRARQLSEAFLFDDFTGFPRASRRKVLFATMTRYRRDFPCLVAFDPQGLEGHLGQVVSEAGLRQLRIAETEKYAHVTFFFSGGDEAELPGESRILIPSPKVATYDMQPQMSAPEVTDRLMAALDAEDAPRVVVLNYANADMVGHTGVFDAAVSAVKTLDGCLERIVKRVVDAGGTVAITADHGNCEMMLDPETGKVHTAHTTNPVPLLLAGNDLRGKSLRAGGRLCDIAPTLLPLVGLDPHPLMNGVNLL
jgi:2,3-bisphosphoglycerate-independent phosphoglycerate mutase